MIPAAWPIKTSEMDIILRDFSSGSNASTYLCARDQKLYYKKTAEEPEAQKLRVQCDWLLSCRRKLPVAEPVIREESENRFSYYMPAEPDCINFFEFIHRSSEDESWAVMASLLKDLREKLYQPEGDPLSDDALERYLDEKFCDNLKLIEACGDLKDLLAPERLTINGRSYRNLEALKPFFRKDMLKELFRGEVFTLMHGDLTIENIICRGDGSYYLIDPNPVCPISCPDLDYSKLLQSLHGLYEFLGGNLHFRRSGNVIEFGPSYSAQYALLYGNYRLWMRKNLDETAIRRIYYHEIIHWLRLMPYRIKKGEAAQYYTRLIMLMNELTDQYGSLNTAVK